MCSHSTYPHNATQIKQRWTQISLQLSHKRNICCLFDVLLTFNNQNLSSSRSFIFHPVYLVYHPAFYQQTTSKLLSATLPQTSSAFSFPYIDPLCAPALPPILLLYCFMLLDTPYLRGHHVYLKCNSGCAARLLKGCYFTGRFSACLTLGEEDAGTTPCAGVWKILRLALLYTERWIKDWQDLPLHQMRIWTKEGKRSKQWGGIEALFCFYSRSFFLSAGSESSLRPSHYWRQSFPE